MTGAFPGTSSGHAAALSTAPTNVAVSVRNVISLSAIGRLTFPPLGGKCQKWRGGKRIKSKGRKRQHTGEHGHGRVEEVPALPYPVYQSQLHPAEMMQQAVQAVEAYDGMATHQQEWDRQQQAYAAGQMAAGQMAVAQNSQVQQQRTANV